MYTTHNQKPIGIIVGEATSTSFVFSSTRELCPSRLDYLVVKSRELIDDEMIEINVLAQVERVMSSSVNMQAGTGKCCWHLKAMGMGEHGQWMCFNFSL